MSVSDTIEDKLARHITVGNLDPENLYLGHREHDMLTAVFHREQGRYSVRDVKDSVTDEETRTEWMGLKVFKVDAASHIGFS